MNDSSHSVCFSRSIFLNWQKNKWDILHVNPSISTAYQELAATTCIPVSTGLRAFYRASDRGCWTRTATLSSATTVNGLAIHIGIQEGKEAKDITTIIFRPIRKSRSAYRHCLEFRDIDATVQGQTNESLQGLMLKEEDHLP